MDNKLAEKIERLEAQLPRWEKWLYACFGAAFTLLAQALVKAHENVMMTDALFSVEAKTGVTISSVLSQYLNAQSEAQFSLWRVLLWFIVSLVAVIPAFILTFHPTWRKVALAKRLDLIFSYLFVTWVVMLSLWPHDPFSVWGGEYNYWLVGYILTLGLGYWWLRRKREKAEEVFP